MDGSEPDKKVEKVKTARMQDLILRIERGREGVNTCRFKDECARSTQCPSVC